MTKKFIIPTIDQLIQKFREKGCNDPHLEANKFFCFYDSKGWMVGKNKMKSWPSAVAGWILRTQGAAPRRPTTIPGPEMCPDCRHGLLSPHHIKECQM